MYLFRMNTEASMVSDEFFELLVKSRAFGEHRFVKSDADRVQMFADISSKRFDLLLKLKSLLVNILLLITALA
jgi:hypothetical protein